MSGPAVRAALEELQDARHSHAIAYVVDRFAPSDVYVLYECLRAMGRVQRLDVVLHTGGGDVDLTRRIALLLHEYADELRILVPDHAESAGTLLCLGAHRLVLGPMSRLGPIDPHISSAGEGPSNAPARISSEDVRAFREMAESWFGLDGETDRRETFAAVTQRLFPTTLSAFYRSDRNVRRVGRELFAYQRPELGSDARGRVVDHLVSGYDSHTHVITRVEATELGLRVEEPSAREEDLLWECARTARDLQTGPPGAGDVTLGVIASGAGFQARHVLAGGLPGTPAGPMPAPQWTIDSGAGAPALGEV